MAPAPASAATRLEPASASPAPVCGAAPPSAGKGRGAPDENAVGVPVPDSASSAEGAPAGSMPAGCPPACAWVPAEGVAVPSSEGTPVFAAWSRSAISRLSEEAEIRMVAPLTRSPSASSSSGSSGATGAGAGGVGVQAGWKAPPDGRFGTATGGPAGGGGGVAGPVAGAGGAGFGGAWGAVFDAPEAFCVYQAGGA